MPEAKRVDETEDHAYLGREFLTWLLWRVDVGEATFGDGAKAFTVAFGARARVGGLTGNVTDAVFKGHAPAHGAEARAAIGAGRTVREAELRVTRGEREWRFTLLADSLDLRSVKLPALLTEEEDDRFLERISLLEELDDVVKTAFGEFVRERVRPAWRRSIVPSLKDWLVEGLATA